jgi:Fic family protein
METGMQPYQPDLLPLRDLDFERLFPLIGPANAALARYDGLLQSVINPLVMLSPLTTREAVLSSRIEGTQATVDEVLEFEAGIEFDPEKTKDIQEVVNYRKALSLATDALKNQSLGLYLIRQMHATLMNSVRGEDKDPGRFRSVQNWIGPAGCRMEEATFVPPAPLQLHDHLEAFERYLSADDQDPLLQVAVVHAQFELIHPFKDGNGRVGRLLIPLFLYQKQALGSPMFYISEFLETNRSEYYERLNKISASRDWTGWIEFFLRAIREQAETNTARVRSIMQLYESMKTDVTDMTRSQHSMKILDTLFDRPIFNSTDFVERSGIPRPTALVFLRKLKAAGIIVPLSSASGSRSARYAFRELLNRAEGRTII